MTQTILYNRRNISNSIESPLNFSLNQTERRLPVAVYCSNLTPDGWNSFVLFPVRFTELQQNLLDSLWVTRSDA